MMQEGQELEKSLQRGLDDEGDVPELMMARSAMSWSPLCGRQGTVIMVLSGLIKPTTTEQGRKRGSVGRRDERGELLAAEQVK